MKAKFLLIAISCTTLLFTSCEDELDRDITGGGGKESANTYSNMKRNVEQSYPDSLLYESNKKSSLGFE